MRTLKLFNAVISKESTATPVIDNDLGLVIEPNATWDADAIIDFYHKEKLSGNDLNKTFYNSWKTIRDSSRFELYLDQILHYFTTYGTNFKAEAYIPREVVDIPDLKIVYKVIKGYTVEEMTEKCLDMLKSGIALQEETIDDLLSILHSELGYVFTGKEGIRNKEAIIKIADTYGVLPNNPVEMLRYIVYRATDSTLLIKDPATITAIKGSSFNPVGHFTKSPEKFAEIFNRFKPLFLAFKGKCPKAINKISKLSKTCHKPMVQNPLNNIGGQIIQDEDMHWIENATQYALFKALAYCHSRMMGQDAFVYRIRNGKSWVRETEDKVSSYAAAHNFDIVSKELQKRFDLSKHKVYIPKGIDYAMPTSEKLFVGNVPTGTKFTGKKLAVGIYWENKWGARDLDLAGLNIGGKVGWNSNFRQGKSLYFSGDITDAPRGAVEYLYATNGLDDPTLVMNNVFSGSDTCDYKIVVGKGSKVSHDYMMNPNKLFTEVKCKSVEHQTVLGMFLPYGEKQSFVLLNFGAGQARVSGNNKVSNAATKALYQQWSNPYMLKDLLFILGAKLVDTPEEATHDLSMENLEKDTLMKLFDPIIEEEVEDGDEVVTLDDGTKIYHGVTVVKG